MFSNFKNLASSESDHFFILTHGVADPISYDPDPSFHFEIGQDPDNILFGRLGSRNKFNFRLTIFHHRLFWEDILPDACYCLQVPKWSLEARPDSFQC